ncbi:MAG: DUF1326 domain-containing protein [Planctomycetaceae bacterium]|nr:DUF1326 domain-containing protein [Planctomycetaceae bacterium]
MKAFSLLLTTMLWMVSADSAFADKITGEYLEARTCDVYTGPCFANAEMSLAGKEAVMAWKVDQGSWKNVTLDGLGVALVVKAEGTLGTDGIFPMQAGKTAAVIIVDENASTEQRDALVAFVKDNAKDLTKNVINVVSAPITLKNDHLEGKGVFSAGKLASIETRQMKKNDCVCTNEMVFYQPLTKVENFAPAYALRQSFQGEGLNGKWTNNNTRSAFLATFRVKS